MKRRSMLCQRVSRVPLAPCGSSSQRMSWPPQLYSSSFASSARVMALVVHPYIMGVPHRLRYFRDAIAHMRQHDDVAFWTGEHILDWYIEAGG